MPTRLPGRSRGDFNALSRLKVIFKESENYMTILPLHYNGFTLLKTASGHLKRKPRSWSPDFAVQSKTAAYGKHRRVPYEG
jgi:hypothetical protein